MAQIAALRTRCEQQSAGFKLRLAELELSYSAAELARVSEPAAAPEPQHEQASRVLRELSASEEAHAEASSAALIAAAQQGDCDAVARELAAGADPNCGPRGSPMDGPLHQAANYGHPAACAALVTGGANPNQEDMGGSTPVRHYEQSTHAGSIFLAIAQRVWRRCSLLTCALHFLAASWGCAAAERRH